MEPEITTKLGRMGVRIVERPISYQPRSKAEGKKIRSTDLLRYLVAMVRYRFFRQVGAPIPIPEQKRADKDLTSNAAHIYAMQTA
jgi:hypothetical protein